MASSYRPRGGGRRYQPKSRNNKPPPNTTGYRNQHRPATKMVYRRKFDAVRDNYNKTAKDFSMDDRQSSPLRDVRDLNNWCKYVNITFSIQQAFYVNHNCKISVLDLACGKGGDLRKFRGNKSYVHRYVGIDIAEKCIENARNVYQKLCAEFEHNRYASYQERQRFNANNQFGQSATQFFDDPMFYAHFQCFDMNTAQLVQQPLITKNGPFHLINIQFALHYAFQSKSKLHALLSSIRDVSQRGTYLTCSFVRDEIIIQRLQKNLDCDDHGNDEDGYECKQKHVNADETMRFKNAYQAIKMKKETFEHVQHLYDEYALHDALDINYMKKSDIELFEAEKANPLIGVAYTYYQQQSVTGDNDEGVEEYLICFKYLCYMLYQQCGMKLVYKSTAKDIYDGYRITSPYCWGYEKRQLKEWRDLNVDELQVVDTYAYALFEKVL
mmetsp:Transcript_31517/g.51029  ORF Transcript_31517/g.51029 Transcript_31517/m.51029 type:complete len:440 (+) Transcript_31517:26-1345(+)